MKLETPLIAMLLGGIFFFGMYTFYYDIAETYQEAGLIEFDSNMALSINNNTVNITAAYNKINATKQDVDDLSVEISELKPSLTSVWPAIEIVFKTGTLLISSILNMKELGTASAQTLGIDPIVTDTLFIILIGIMVVAVVAFLAGRTQ